MDDTIVLAYGIDVVIHVQNISKDSQLLITDFLQALEKADNKQ